MPNNKFSQISLFDIYEDVNTSFTEKKSELVSLLEKHIDFSSLISYEFSRAYYSSLGRKHKYHLVSFIKVLVIQKLFAFNLDSQLIFDTTGIEPYVAGNNPKFLNSKLKEAKKLSKAYPEYNPYTGVYSMLPDTAKTNSSVKQQYINGHYCYSHKIGIMTNVNGIIRDISFFDDDFKKSYPHIVTKKSNNPDPDKEISDSHTLKLHLNISG